MYADGVYDNNLALFLQLQQPQCEMDLGANIKWIIKIKDECNKVSFDKL